MTDQPLTPDEVAFHDAANRLQLVEIVRYWRDRARAAERRVAELERMKVGRSVHHG